MGLVGQDVERWVSCGEEGSGKCKDRRRVWQVREEKNGTGG
jgi:hypothetical protein